MVYSMSHAARAVEANETVLMTPSKISAYASRGATASSEFLTLSALAPTGPQNTFKDKRSKVVGADTFEAARLMRAEGAIESTIAVLNLASDEYPGGGWIHTLSETQEEALCYSSTLYATLEAQKDRYPWPNTGPGSDAGLFSPGVVVWKDTLSNQCRELPEADVMVVGVITVAAPRWPKLAKGWDGEETFADKGVLEDLKRKLRLIFRMAATNGRSNLVLGPLGCGAYRCPKKVVAKEMKDVMLEKEFAGVFERVWVAIRDPRNEGNLASFGEFMHDVKLGEREEEGA